ncbi:hypothetical protein BAUCODRAFT_35681 [Baudoinia panamericana UAMH 10762]|uniref:Heterokaryon incompatibility domain-containing protein n=1 Tax=Baudoinia panamericana (strain UAMH 10762) TaxID=717646 RepID=M2MD68_BAUPA|nr:uncharacterized protein BAUCODRAFT_35681 [Baudoinia panamericana UAMH 10762]EMC94466.1 hypothetical protein BAUCODRAFT_35681 [Baudoinia panamericana UAMH 10762]
MSPTRLCPSCAGLDIRALFMAAAKASPGSPTHWAPPLSDRSRRRRDGVFRFYQLHANLRVLKESANWCDFCKAICTQFLRLREGKEITDEELSSGVSTQPVYLDIDDWELGVSRAPHVIVTQYSPMEDTDTGEEPVGRRLAYFEVCETPGREPSEQRELFGRVQASSPLETPCIEQAQAWLSDCTHSHALCNQVPPSQHLPTRVLDVSHEPDKVYLINGQTHSGKYAALSYVWGTEPTLILTEDDHNGKGTLENFYAGLALPQLPGTLKDAVITTRILGLRYLWIDAMCIIQNSAQDWAAEAGRMSQVYRGAAVTIEAASASRAGDGFLRPRVSSKPYVELEWRSSSAEVQSVQMRPIYDISETQLTSTTIFSRGWTLQERLLAPRTLSFGEQQISFECAEGYKDEAGRLAMLPQSTEYYLLKRSMLDIRQSQGVIFSTMRWLAAALGLPRFQLYTPFGLFETHRKLLIYRDLYASYDLYWRLIIERFSDRQLTHSRDHLPALSGLAAELQRATGDTYCAGFWWSDLLPSLAWRTSQLINANGIQADGYLPNSNYLVDDWPAGIRATEYVAPSWSWASVRSPVRCFNERGQLGQHTPLARVLRVDLKPRFLDRFGLLDHGYLDIKGPVLPIPDIFRPCLAGYQHPNLHQYVRQQVLLDNDRASEVYQHHQDLEGGEQPEYALLKLLTWNSKLYKEPGTQLECLLLESCDPDCSKWRRLCQLTVEMSGFLLAIEDFLRRQQMVTFKRDLGGSSYDPSDDRADATRRQHIALDIANAEWKTQVLRLC